MLEENNEDNNNPRTDGDDDTKAYLKMVDDDNKELYPGCKNFSKLRFIVKLLHIKLLGRWSDKSFDMVLELLSDAFPKGSVLPKNFNEAKKIVKSVGLGYVNIHACENDCVLFRNEFDKDNSVQSVKLQGGNQKRRVLMGKGYIEFLERFFAIFLLKEGFKGTLCPLKLQLT